MCYSPITIKNNSKLYRPLVSKDLVQVPCGKCRECIERKKSDWFIRIFYEWKRVRNLGGKVFFITLTYNNYHEPFLDTSDIRFTPLSRFLADFIYNRIDLSLSEDDKSEFLRRYDRYVERYEETSFAVPLFKHSCFNDKHLVSFFKSLRQNLNNLGYLSYSEESLKYYFCCEFGDDKKRPHYHALIFYPKYIDNNVFLKICRRSWSYRVKRSECPGYVLSNLDFCSRSQLRYYNFSSPGTEWRDWHICYQSNSNRYIVYRQYGFLNYSDKGATIENVQGCKYLTNYLNYYDSYLRDLGFDKLLDYIKLFPNFDKVYGFEKYKELIIALKQVFPFRRSSYNFGSDLYDEFSSMSDSDVIEKVRKKSIVVSGDSKLYPVPSYIIQRLFYDRILVPECVNPVCVLTPLGYDSLVAMFDDKVQAKLEKYNVILKVLKGFLKKSDYDDFEDKFGYSINDILFNIPLGFSLSDLSKFDIVLNGVSVSHSLHCLRLENFTASELIDNVFDIYINQLMLRNPAFVPPECLFDDLYYLKINSKTFLKERTFNSLPQFDFYDKFLTVLYYIYNVVLVSDAQAQEEKYTSHTKVRDAINKFRFTN